MLDQLLIPLVVLLLACISPVDCFAANASIKRIGYTQQKINLRISTQDLVNDRHRRSFRAVASSLSSDSNADDEATNEIDGGLPGGAQNHVKDPGMWPRFDELDRRLIKISLPVIANFAINPLIGAVDLFWVNRMGNALAVASQAAANQVFNSAFWITSFLPAVTATLIAKEKAQGNEEGVQDAVCQAIFVGVFIALVTTALCSAKPNQILSSVLSQDAPAMEYARPYLLIRTFAFVPSLISLVGFSAFRGVLDTVTPVKISLFANLFNALLDPILIFNMGMGVTGAALATLAAELISCIMYLILMRKRNMLSFRKLFMLPKWARLEPLIRGGAALQLRNVSLNVTFLAVARVTQGIDKTGVAAAAHAMAIQGKRLADEKEYLYESRLKMRYFRLLTWMFSTVFQLGGIVLLALSTVAQTVVPTDMVERVDKTLNRPIGGKKYAKWTVNRLMSWGLLLGIGLGSLQLILLPFIQQSTPLQSVRDASRTPAILASVYQIINGMVFIGEGVMVGSGSFLQLSMSTVIATVGCLWALRAFPPIYGLTGVWMGFGVFNILRLGGVFLHQRFNGPLAPKNIEKA